MAFTCILLCFTRVDLRQDIQRFFVEGVKYGPMLLFVLASTLFVTSGFVLSLSNVFVPRQKSLPAKTCMAAFAMSVNGMAGIRAGMELLGETPSALVAFPVINIIAGVGLLYQMSFCAEGTISDEPARFLDLVIGGVALGVVFTYCQSQSQLSWAIVLSICVSYATTFHHMVCGVARQLYHAMREA